MSARIVGLIIALNSSSALIAAQPTPPIREVVAGSNSPAATFSARLASGLTFRTLPEQDDLYSGDLIVSLPGGTLTSKNGAVRLKSLTDYDVRSPLPILETAFVFKRPAEADTDLDVVLDRGRIDLSNVKPSGSATVRVRFRDQNWKIVLQAPDSRVAIELVARWPSGERFRPAKPNVEPARLAAPVSFVVLRVLRGEASVNVEGTTVSMRAPPGPAELRWNSLDGVQPQPQRLDKLPDWVNPPTNESDSSKVFAACEKFRLARIHDEAKTLDTFLESENLIERRIALVALGGQDELDRLQATISSAKHQDVWDFGIVVLRHWLGRTPGNDQRLYSLLTTQMGFSASQASIIIQLLLGFSADDLSRRETFQVLIEYLMNEKPIIRNLAAWHLVRLYPEGKAIPFKTSGTDEEVRAFYSAWKELSKMGKFPSQPAKP